MPSKLLSFTLTFLFLVLFFYVLVAGRDMLIPFAIAIMFWYLLNALTRSYQLIPLGKRRLPRKLALALAVLSFGLVLALLLKLVSSNMADVALTAPTYQAHLQTIIENIARFVGLPHAPDFAQIERQIDVGAFLTSLAGALAKVASNTGIILIYVAFLFVEQMSFDLKLSALFKDPHKEETMRGMLRRMAQEIETYVLIKTFLSTVVGLASYAILALAGVDYAAFWGFLVFLVNYIPTVGPILAVIFPSLLTLVQFETVYVFLGVISSLGILQFLVANILEPKIMGKSLNLSPLVIILALVLWGNIWGVAGMFLSVPITVIIAIICSYIPQARPIAILLSSNGQIKTGS
jgi:predicted PurR-regulated permease PerM